jgi:hypothetical protein
MDRTFSKEQIQLFLQNQQHFIVKNSLVVKVTWKQVNNTVIYKELNKKLNSY